jgi:hypothetical protein
MLVKTLIAIFFVVKTVTELMNRSLASGERENISKNNVNRLKWSRVRVRILRHQIIP